MATVSTLPQQKRRKNVYGKLGRSKWSTSNVDLFFDEDELATSKPTVGRQSNVKATYTVKKTEVKANTSKPARPRTKKLDTFDVPSSDDEVEVPAKVVSPPRFRPKLVDDTETSSIQLAPWEKRQVPKSAPDRNGNGTRHKTTQVVSEARLGHDNAWATKSPERSSSATSTSRKESTIREQQSLVTSLAESQTVGTTSTAALLAARRKCTDGGTRASADELPRRGRTVPKRSALATEDAEGTPRKRLRTQTLSKEGSADVSMDDPPPAPVCESPPEDFTSAHADVDIYGFPGSSADETASPKPAMPKSKKGKQPSRRGKLATRSHSTPQKGSSAPARLAEMVGTDTETTEAPTRSPSASTSRKSTPQQPSTPPSGRIGSPSTAIRASGAMTPKQASLWNKLLPNDPAVPSPSALPIKELSISGKRRTAAPLFTSRLTKSQSDVPRRRTRLVDRLKASAPSSDDELSEEDDEGEEMEGVQAVERNAVSVSQRNEQAPNPAKQTSRSQSQSQSTSTTTGGSKITYSRTRSYLPEDSLGDDLMYGMISDTPKQRPASRPGIGKPNGLSQKSAFDLDDSEDESGPGRMRTIHELRASGSNARGIGDIEDLLDAIEKHTVSHKSSRRTALISLATNLMDKAFKGRFIGQSCEVRLAAECGAYSDDIADTVLAAAIALLMSSDPPEHVIRSLHDQGAIPWLAQLLHKDVELSKLAKERRHNMSKSSQGSLVEFASKLKEQAALWDEQTPDIITPRLIALKALDQLVRSLRRLGDKSELLNADQLQAVFRDPAAALDQTRFLEAPLSISVLESLSTTSLPLNWPPAIFEGLGSILPRLDCAVPLLRHARFLALRLCLNLTNDNARNCALLADQDAGSTVRHLLQAIRTGFESLNTLGDANEDRTVALDFLVLAIGIMINLAENSSDARKHASTNEDLLADLLAIFRQGQKNLHEAESVEESVTNVTFGYLAVMLANLCQDTAARTLIASKLPGQHLGMLVEAVEEFVLHHQKVDTMTLEGEEGREVWGAFTEKLKVVLARVKEVEQTV
ncbi:hypothetical protein LTR37_006207 [Vermiconidia calcicola]|uniref:Uncharacterized protein n=1 Tax=Vermiconidia calcicola TaxID=1690605 RepID=A0ACC3NHI9_9PEZI|nr:hypothetical protein LTR37_006207 [Vermiconidia calcicola]